jgi:hypothetical protein
VSVDPHEVQRATELIELASSRTLEHLRLARDLSRRIRGDDAALAERMANAARPD